MELERFLMELTNETVTLELENGTLVRGTITGVDAAMNTYLEDVTVVVKGQNPIKLDTLCVRRKKIIALLGMLDFVTSDR